MKRVFLFIFLGFLTANIFSITPHINKGQLEELSLSQALKELQITENELQQLDKDFFGVLEENNNFPPVQEVNHDEKVQVFKQTFKETDEIFYRVILYTEEQIPSGRFGYFQKGYYSKGTGKPNLIFADFYDAECTVFGQSVTAVQLNYNFMPVIKENKIAGIMIYGIESYKELLHHKAAVYWKDDFLTADLRNTYSNQADIYIECSKPLIDEKDTFKYTIQNAFDKNPATSYVEDTDDDLMYVNVGLTYKNKKGENESINNQKLAIINGYAKNLNLYKKNNRVREINGDIYSRGELLFEHKEYVILSDSTFDYQVFNWEPRESFSVKKIYQGTDFNDTCIAELDFFNKKMGWVFGGLN